MVQRGDTEEALELLGETAGDFVADGLAPGPAWRTRRS